MPTKAELEKKLEQAYAAIRDAEENSRVQPPDDEHCWIEWRKQFMAVREVAGVPSELLPAESEEQDEGYW